MLSQVFIKKEEHLLQHLHTGTAYCMQDSLPQAQGSGLRAQGQGSGIRDQGSGIRV